MVKCKSCENYVQHDEDTKLDSACIKFAARHVNPDVERMCDHYSPVSVLLKCPDCGSESITYRRDYDDLKTVKNCSKCGSRFPLDSLIPKMEPESLTESKIE